MKGGRPLGVLCHQHPLGLGPHSAERQHSDQPCAWPEQQLVVLGSEWCVARIRLNMASHEPVTSIPEAASEGLCVPSSVREPEEELRVEYRRDPLVKPLVDVGAPLKTLKHRSEVRRWRRIRVAIVKKDGGGNRFDDDAIEMHGNDGKLQPGRTYHRKVSRSENVLGSEAQTRQDRTPPSSVVVVHFLSPRAATRRLAVLLTDRHKMCPAFLSKSYRC